MRGVPVRIEIGPKDLENGVAVLVRRDTGEKETIELNKLKERLGELLDNIQNSMFEACEKRREEKTTVAFSLEEIAKNLNENQGYVKTMWCGNVECEDLSDVCPICGKKAEKMIVWGRQY